MRLAHRTAVTVAVLTTAGSITGIAQADTTPRHQNAASRPAAAPAPSCDWHPSANGSGSMRTNKPIRLRYGPAASCDWIGWTNMPKNQKLWARCKTVNGAGNTWYYVRPEPPEGEYWDPGWIYSGNVTNVPSGIPNC